MVQIRSGNSSFRTAGFFTIVCAITFLCYMPDIKNGFVQTWDDGPYVIFNEHIRNLSFETVRWAFFDIYAYFWGPLTWLSLAVDYAIWQLNPAGYHLTNDLIHALNSGMFFILSQTLLTRFFDSNSSDNKGKFEFTSQNILYCSILSALIFAVHPLRVESVAWITEIKDELSLFFGIPAILAYIRHTAPHCSPSKNAEQTPFSFITSYYYWLAFIFFTLSLFSKSTLVTLPIILLILDWFPLNRHKYMNYSTLLIEKVPFLVVAAGTSLMIMDATNKMPFSTSNALSRVLIAFRSIFEYLFHTIYPLNLSPFYPHPGNIATVGFEYLFPIFVCIIITSFSIYCVRNKPFILAAWLLYLVALLPVIGFIQVGFTSMADRFTYFPALPISLFIAVCITVFMSKFPARSVPFFISFLIVIAALLSLYGLTFRQLQFWKNDVTLWSRAIEMNPHTTGKMYFQRASGYEMAGNDASALQDMNEAVVIALRKKHTMMYELYVKRARIHKRLGNLSEAVEDYGNALATDSSAMRSVYYQERGNIYRELGKTEQADRDMQMAAELKQPN